MVSTDPSVVPFNSESSSSALAGPVDATPTSQFVPTPENWRDRLLLQLDTRQKRITVFDDYYRGKHKLQFASAKFKAAFGTMFSAFADNWCPIVVDAVEERLSVEGFRLPGAEDADKDAWHIWQVNDLDANSQLAHTEALIGEESYALVGPPGGAEDPDVATITIEHPSQMIVARAPDACMTRLAALKQWLDDDGFLLCTLYTPLYIFKWRSTKPQQTNGGQTTTKWDRRVVPGETWPMVNPLNVVPVVPITNRPRLLTGGESEIASVIPVQDAINKLIADMILASEYASFKQRYTTGIEIPVDPQTGQQIDPFAGKMGPGQVLMNENPAAKFGEFSESDLSGYRSGVEMLVQHVASQSRTPPHYFYLSGQFPSGESIKSAEAGLVAKTRRKMKHFGESWEEIISLAFLAQGDKRGSEQSESETIWGDPEYRTEGEHVDAVLKMGALGIPDEILWEFLNLSPQLIGRIKQINASKPPPPAPIIVQPGVPQQMPGATPGTAPPATSATPPQSTT